MATTGGAGTGGIDFGGGTTTSGAFTFESAGTAARLAVGRAACFFSATLSRMDLLDQLIVVVKPPKKHSQMLTPAIANLERNRHQLRLQNHQTRPAGVRF